MLDQTAATLALRNRALSVVAARTTAFARASTATYTDVNGIVQTAAINQLRNAHYILGVLQPPLIELASTNSAKWSRDQTQASWPRTGAGTSALDSVGLDGTSNSATTVTDSDAAATTSWSQAITIPNDSSTHCVSFYIKKDSDTSRFPLFGLALSGGTPITRAVSMNTSTGVVVLNAGGSGTNRGVDAGLWWVVEITVNNNSSGNTILTPSFRPAYGTTINIANVAATGSMVLGHVQVELNTSAYTSPIFTTTVAATRAADIDQMLAATATGYTRQIGSFLTEGFADGMEFVPAGFSDVTPKVIESVSAGAIVTTTAPTAQTAVAGRSLSVGFPAIQGFDNRKCNRIERRPYTEEEFVPGGHSLMGTTSGYNNEDGLYLIKYYGLEGKGVAGIRKWCDALKALFAPGTNLVAGSNTVRVRTDVSVKSGQILPQGNGWAVCTVTVPWWALSNNAVAA